MATLEIFSPFDQSKISELPLTEIAKAKKMLDKAHACFKDRANWLSIPERIEILQKTAALMQEQREDLATEAAREGGKPLIDSLVEVDRAINGVKVAINEMHHMTGRQIPMNITASSANRIAYTFREPGGVVMAISAFNHPLNLAVHQIIPAIAVGCPIIIKPASSTPLSCFKLVSLLYKAGLPEDYCQALVCHNDVAEELVSSQKVSFLSFIGSAKVGFYLKSKLAPGSSCALEHGGAAPVIFEADADLDAAVPLLTKGGFYHAGQVCVSVQRVFAHNKVAKTLAKKIADQAKNLVVGDPVLPETEVGPLIATKEVNRVEEWVKQAVHNGAKLMCGGERISDTCYAPTVLLDPPFDAEVSKHEVFGPVVCVYSYKNRAEAIEQANRPPFCFQASVFSKDLDTILDTVKKLQATAVMVNDHTAFRVDWMPFGGRKHSGENFGGIPYSMHDMSYEKMCVIKSAVL